MYMKKNLSLKMRFNCPKEPNLPVVPIEPTYPEMPNLFVTAIVCIFYGAMFGLFWLFISTITFFVVTFSSLSDNVGDTIIYGSAGVFGIIYSIFAIYSLWSIFHARRKKREEYVKELENYKDKMWKYEENMEKYQQEHLQWRCQVALWKQECKQLESSLDNSMSNREQLYAAGVLAPKYRNFVAVCSLFEYFQSGSCETMKEAYNKYDQELLLGHIVNRIDEILTSLNEIKLNQVMLCSTIQLSNRLLSQLIQRTNDFYTQTSRQLTNIEQSALNTEDKTSEILQNSAITAYCSETAQKELSFMRRMSQYDGIIGSSWPV